MGKLVEIVAYRTVIFIVWLTCLLWVVMPLVYGQTERAAFARVLRTYDFTREPDGDAKPWLLENGFEARLDADALHPRFENGLLVLSTRGEAAGIFGRKYGVRDYIRGIKKVRLEWGVRRYPVGADWSKGVNRLPIAVMFTFGTEKLPSGLPFGFEDAPRFISAFIGLKEIEGRTYIGKYWQEGGRYICVASGDRSGDTIISELELDERFKATFGQDRTPPITAFAFQMNTEDTRGSAEAFLRKVEFIGK